MTLSTLTSRISYAGNGATTVFSFPYYFLEDGDLTVILRVDSTGVETTKTITTHYTVSGAGVQAGGSVTMLTAPATGETLTILRDPDVIQEVDLRENDNLPAETVEQELDRNAMVNQRQQNLIERSVRLSEGYAAAFDPILPSLLVANSTLVINSGATGLSMGPTTTAITNAEANATAAAASASAASSSASAASASASSASSSASSAAAAVASAFFRDVVYKTFADSPVTIAQADNGKLYSFDSSGGAISVTLPQISGLTLPFNITFLLSTGANAVTLNRSGTDTINAATSATIAAAGAGAQLAADTDGAPDNWSLLNFGTTVADGSITTAKLADGAVTIPKLNAAASGPDTADNYALACSVGSSALTIARKDKAGSDCSASSPARFAFRNATAATGTYDIVSVTGALSTVISSGSSAGHLDGVQNYIYVYLLNNAGTAELAWSTRRFDDGSVQSSTAEGGAGAADSASVLYSTTARSNVAIRLIARLTSTQATAGTWAAVPTEISLGSNPLVPPITTTVANTSPMRIVSGYITNNGTAAIGHQYGSGIASVSRTGAGLVTVNLDSGIFTQNNYHVVASRTGSSGAMGGNCFGVEVVSATQFKVEVRDTSNVGSDVNFYFIAIGEK